MLDHGAGPHLVGRPPQGLTQFLEQILFDGIIDNEVSIVSVLLKQIGHSFGKPFQNHFSMDSTTKRGPKLKGPTCLGGASS
ncbi:MAG: hypothetical protein CME16_03375 [Gemmatimonadetes bacterium]|nr:hypothetical protein [Gemmatimonadota bacterium]|tara:strand:- start:249 stop:491 length:243 start_codon:yes stop_codon:yes gene_type:complete